MRSQAGGTKSLSEAEYRREFGIEPRCTAKHRRALQHALDIRKFEIELYWKRSTYFWTFIAAALAGFGAIQVGRDIPPRQQLSVLVSSLGLVFSFSWWCVNKGSKRWQENWENHVDMLENEFIGPLYKTVASRPPVAEHTKLGPFWYRWLKHGVAGPAPFSVSNINQIVSLFVTLVWLLLIAVSVGPLDLNASINWFVVGVVALAILTCVTIWIFGRSDSIDYSFVVRQRTSRVNAAKQSLPRVGENASDDESGVPIGPP